MNSCAVITRTKSRPILLQRAMASVVAQSFRDFTWVIVNDGGETGPVDKVAADARAGGLEVKVLHRTGGGGMEAASNAGIRASQSQYIAIHDDDDSWSPRFLQQTVAWLAQHPGYVGVCTHASRITERIEGGTVREVRNEPHLPVLKSIHLAEILRSNQFPPIAFLYRRLLYEKLGAYDESMEILGDWDFNIRALLEGDIGVIPEVLANYHVRSPEGTSADYMNSVPPGALKQAMADAAYRNRWIRNDLASGKAGLGFLLAQARLQRETSPIGALASKLRRYFR